MKLEKLLIQSMKLITFVGKNNMPKLSVGASYRRAKKNKERQDKIRKMRTKLVKDGDGLRRIA